MAAGHFSEGSHQASVWEADALSLSGAGVWQARSFTPPFPTPPGSGGQRPPYQNQESLEL